MLYIYGSKGLEKDIPIPYEKLLKLHKICLNILWKI